MFSEFDESEDSDGEADPKECDDLRMSTTEERGGVNLIGLNADE